MHVRFCFITAIRKGWRDEDILFKFGKQLDFVNWNCLDSKEFKEMKADFEQTLSELELTVWRKEFLYFEEVKTQEYIKFIVLAFDLQTMESLLDFFPVDDRWAKFVNQNQRLCNNIIEECYPKEYNELVRTSKLYSNLTWVFIALFYYYLYLLISFLYRHA